MNTDKAQIFISYSHLDEEYKDILNLKLKTLEREGRLEVWTDREISEGDEWLPEIEAKLNSCDVAVLLISDNFLTSDFIMDKEVPLFLDRREHYNLKLYPLIIDHCNWEKISWLSELAGAMKDNIPLSEDKELIGKKLTELVNRIDDYCQSYNIGKLRNSKQIEIPRVQLPTQTYTSMTTLPPKNKDFIGRVSELKSIEDNLQSNNVVCVVNGIGGVGKSELSFEYLHIYKERYNRIAFIELSEEQTLEETFFIKFQDSLQLRSGDNFDTILKRLQGFRALNLLLLDNLQRVEDFEKLKPLNLNFDILITSRTKLDSNNVINLETLNPQDAKQLFLSIYPTDNSIDNVLNYLDNHPLFIKLIAYSLKEEYVELDELQADIDNGNIGKIDSTDNKTFKEHLQKTFERQFDTESKKELKELLQTLAIFPAMEIDVEVYKKVLGDDRIKAKLQKLVNRGWLIKKENSYKLHQIIKTFLLEEYPVIYDNVTYVLDNIGKIIDTNDSTLIISDLNHYIPLIDSLLVLFKEHKDEHIAILLDSNTYLYYSLGEYKDSLQMQENSYAIRKDLYGDKTVKVAKNLNFLGLLYEIQREYDKAGDFFNEALKIRKVILGENHLDTATSYNNLAGLYSSQRRYYKAEESYKKALKIRKEVVGENHLDTAISYNNLALFYTLQGQYNKAESFHEKALQIKKEILVEKHPSIAKSYDNLARLYYKQKKYDKAEPLYKLANQIKEELLGKNHQKTLNSYGNLVLLYIEMKKCLQIKEYVEKLIKLIEEMDNPSSVDLLRLNRILSNVNKKIKKEKKLKFKKKGRYCVDV